ncbi:MAG: hypothetical protein ACOY5B_13400 [Spirochaetota bacterium]
MAWKIEAVLGTFRHRDMTAELMRSVPGTETLRYTPNLLTKTLQPARVRYLRISNSELPHWRPMLVSPDCSFELRLSNPTDLRQIPVRMVYFVNCYINPRYLYMVSSQLKELRRTGLFEGTRAILYVISSGTEGDRLRLGNELKQIFGESPAVQHEHTTENQFEYPGIHKVWQLGQPDRDGYILYFHARGISHLKLGRFRRNRQRQEKRLFRRVIGEWRQNLTWLQNLASAAKLGINCGGNGWVWFNFWWARASYVHNLEQPVVTDRRHYYEDWLGRYQPPGTTPGEYASNLSQCLSIASAPGLKKYHLGSDFNPHRGETHLGLPWGALKALLVRWRD